MFGGRSGAGRKEYRWKRASTSVFVRFFGKRTGSSASSNSTSAQESAPAMAVSAAGAPLGSEQMDFENSALGELAEEDMLEGMGELCYDSDEMYDEEEKGEERQGVPTDLFGVGLYPVPVPPVPMSPLPLPLPPAMTPPQPQPKKPTMPSARRKYCRSHAEGHRRRRGDVPISPCRWIGCGVGLV